MRIDTFARFGLTTKQGERIDIRAKKARALLVKCALEPGRLHSRSELADLLWRRSLEQARNGLRTCLSNLRGSLGEDGAGALISGREYVSVKSGAITVDAIEFENFAAADDPASWVRAVDLYRGKFLDDLDIAEQQYQLWRSNKQIELMETYRGVVTKLLAHYSQSGEVARGIELARRYLGYDEAEQGMHRFIIRSHLRQGNHSEAHRQYRILDAALRRTSGSGPDRETCELYEQLAAPADQTLPTGSLHALNDLQPIDYHGQPTLVVQPLSSSEAGADLNTLAAGITDDVKGGLSRCSWFTLIERGRVGEAGSRGRDPCDYCRQLGVDFLLRGAVHPREKGTRISAQLLDCRGGKAVWNESFYDDTADLTRVPSQAIYAIVAGAENALTRQEAQRRVEADPPGTDYWDLVFQAHWHFWRTNRRDVETARHLLQAAIEIRPRGVVAIGQLAFCHLTEAWARWTPSPAQAVERAHRLSVRAIAIDEQNAWAHFTLGTTLMSMGQPERAIAEERRALELQPHFAAASGELARMLAFSGEADEAIQLAANATEISPSDPHLSLWIRSMAIACFVKGDVEKAHLLAKEAVAIRPNWYHNHLLLAVMKIYCGEQEAAKRTYEYSRNFVSEFDEATLRVGHPFADDTKFRGFADALRAAGWDG